MHGDVFCCCACVQQAAEAAAEVSGLKQQLQEQQSSAAAAAARLAAGYEQQLAELQQRLRLTAAKVVAQEAEAQEAAGQLRGQLRELDGQAELLRAERDALQVRSCRRCALLQCWRACACRWQLHAAALIGDCCRCAFTQERLVAAVTAAEAAAEAAVDEAVQQVVALQQQLARLRESNAALHQTLEEVHAAAASYKVRCGRLQHSVPGPCRTCKLQC